MLTLEEKCRGNDHQMLSDMKQSLSILPTFSLFWALLVRFIFHQKTLQKQKTQIHQEIEMPVIDL